MAITLHQFEKIDGIRSAMLREEWRDHRTGQPDRFNEARMEARLYDAIIDAVGYEAASNVANIGHYADELITDCLTGKVELLDGEAA